MSEDAHAGSERSSALARGSLQVLMGRVFFLIAGFLIAAILSRSLGPVSYGIYGVVISVLTWCERALSAGIPSATAVLMSRYESERKQVENSARILLFLWSIPLFVGMWVLAPLLANKFGIADGTTYIRIVAVNLPAMSLFYALDGILSGRRKFKAQSALKVFQSGAKLVGVVLLVVIGISLTGALIAHLVATLVTVIIMSFFFPIRMTLPTRKVIDAMLRLALPGGIYAIAFSGLANLSLWQLQASSEVAGETIGYFVASLNLTRILHIVPAALSGVLLATLAWARANSDRRRAKQHVNEAGRLSVVVLVPACMILWVNSAAVMGLIFGHEYAAGGDIFRVLCLAFACFALFDLWSMAIGADGSFRVPAIIAVSLAPMLYMANRLLIPWGGPIGAALANVIVIAFGATIMGILTWKKYGGLVPLMTLARVTLAGATIWILGELFPSTGPWVLVAIAGQSLVYLLVLWLTGELTREDLAALPFVRIPKQTR